VNQGQKTMKDLDKAVNSVNNSILDGATLTNFVATLNNFQSVTADAVNMAKEVRATLDSDLPAVHVALTNFAALSQRLNDTADKLDKTISANTGDVTDAVKSIKASAASLQELADGLQAGKGLAGGLLKDEKMKEQFAGALTNISNMAEEFARFGDTLNHNSLWHILTRKPEATNAPAR
jgi:membrane protease subunit (stomatin/prohibitin family)